MSRKEYVSSRQYKPELEPIVEDYVNEERNARIKVKALDCKDEFYRKEKFTIIPEEERDRNFALKLEMEKFNHLMAMEEEGERVALIQAQKAEAELIRAKVREKEIEDLQRKWEQENEKRKKELGENVISLQDVIKHAIQGLSKLEKSIWDDSR